MEGKMYVNTSKALPIANSIEDLKRHFFASLSNFFPLREAQQIRETFPRASFKTHVVVAAIPNVITTANE